VRMGEKRTAGLSKKVSKGPAPQNSCTTDLSSKERKVPLNKF
jgi:hypothetical protein